MYLAPDDRYLRFAEAYVRLAHVGRAAEEIGLSREAGYYLLQKPDVKHEINRRMLLARAECGFVAVRVSREVAEDQVGSPPAARTAAARLLAEIGDLVGTSREQTRDDRETHELSSDELHAKIVDIERELGNRAVTVSCPLPTDLIDLY